MGWVVNATLQQLYSRERSGTHCTGGWVGPRAGLDGCGKYHPHRDSIPGPCSNWANPALFSWKRGEIHFFGILSVKSVTGLGGGEKRSLWTWQQSSEGFKTKADVIRKYGAAEAPARYRVKNWKNALQTFHSLYRSTRHTGCGAQYCGLSLTHLEARTAEAVSDLPQLLANILPILAGSVVSWHNWRLIITAGASAASWASWWRARRSHTTWWYASSGRRDWGLFWWCWDVIGNWNQIW